MRLPLTKAVIGWEAFAAKHSRKVIALRATLLPQQGALATIDSEGVTLSRYQSKPSEPSRDLTITVHASVLAGLLFSYTPKKMSDKEMATINGDLRLAEDLSLLSPQLAPLLQEPLGALLGPTVASNIISNVTSVLATIQQNQAHAQQEYMKYALEEIAKLPTQKEALELYAKIHALQNRIATLEQRRK